MPCYLQSAIAGVDSDPRAGGVWSAPCVIALKDWSCAINGFEPCQAGDRAALRGIIDVPQGSLSGAKAAVNAYTVSFRVRCMVLLYILPVLCPKAYLGVPTNAPMRGAKGCEADETGTVP